MPQRIGKFDLYISKYKRMMTYLANVDDFDRLDSFLKYCSPRFKRKWKSENPQLGKRQSRSRNGWGKEPPNMKTQGKRGSPQDARAQLETAFGTEMEIETKMEGSIEMEAKEELAEEIKQGEEPPKRKLEEPETKVESELERKRLKKKELMNSRPSLRSRSRRS